MDRERVNEDAARWVVRLSDSPSATDQSEFDAWMAQGGEHELAYMRARMAWQRLDLMSALPIPDSLLEDDAAETALASHISHPVKRQPGQVHMKRLIHIAASFIAISAILTLTIAAVATPRAYATALGEQKTIRLSDGTTIDLNTDTRIVVSYGLRTRTIKLEHGEAMFHIASAKRPFIVRTNTAHLNTQSAELSVRLTGDATQVIVSQGMAMATDNNADAKPVSLTSDTQATVAGQAPRVTHLSVSDMERVMAWRKGVIALNGETLSQAAAEFNRYNQKKIVVSGLPARNIRVGGLFRSTDVDRFVLGVVSTFPVTASEDDDGDIVLKEKL
jgi:transmembrane sensor